jgi:hypothetical protein
MGQAFFSLVKIRYREGRRNGVTIKPNACPPMAPVAMG